MSKQVRWQVLFASISGTKYRVDIYDEQDGTWSGITQLLAGETPFVTEEDSSEDFFAPIRTQTGTLQVCTALPDGGRISLDELLPANNIARPVRLINLDNSNAIEWQGFLSCEAYSQNYTAIPENLSIPVISVLEAMDSVTLAPSSNTMIDISNMIYNVLTNINTHVLMTFFTDIYYSQSSWKILQEKINIQWFYEIDEIQTNDSLSYVRTSCSLKEIIERICTFMGWTAREQGTSIYFQRIGEEIGMFHETLANFGSNFHSNYESISNTRIDMDSLDWIGTKHKCDILQGASRVEVDAELNDGSKIEIQIPDFPFSNPTGPFGLSILKPDGNVLVEQYPWMIAEQNDAYYPHCEYNYMYGDLDKTTTPIHSTLSGNSTETDFLSHLYMRYGQITDDTRYPGACLVNFSVIRQAVGGYRNNERGLYCALLPNLRTAYPNPIFTIKTPMVYYTTGESTTTRIVISCKMIFIGYDTQNSRPIMTEKIDDDFLNIKYARFSPIVRWGNKYYSSGWKTWSGYNSASGADGELKDNGFEISIPITTEMSGDIEIGLPPTYRIDTRDSNILYEIIITDLSIKLEQSDDVTWRDSKENKYINILSTKFRDDIKISTKIASNNNNNKVDVLPFSTIVYTNPDSTTESRRPEMDLLNRLSEYYSSNRYRLELEVKHPTNAALSILIINGINDRKVYIPLYESRDWQTEECTLTCFETLDTQSES